MSAAPAHTHSPLRQALRAQLVGTGLVALLPFASPGLITSPIQAALAQGLCAAFASQALGMPRWWLLLNFAFLPAALWLIQQGIAPGWYLAAFVLLLLTYWRTDRSQVPLYLSNHATTEAVLQLLPPTPCRVVDLGCGSGGLLRQLARARLDCHFVGIEHAPLPWLWARLTAQRLPNLDIRHGDFWRLNLAEFDVIYAFLSPAPMPRLHLRARAGMRPGAQLISNSFAIPGVTADRLVTVADRRATQLHIYHPGNRNADSAGSANNT
ncbi:MAG: class I SAM-dependent methyltransferase [Sterolibacterium sp.]|nr:class I SAM-dependent methyltransferase [Sterolibacterium sp.]